LLLLCNFSSVLPVLVMLSSFLADLDTLAVLPHSKICLGFAEIGSDEFGVTFDSLVAIMDSAGEGHEFDESCCSIAVPSRIFRRPFHHLAVGFDSARPVSCFELLISELAGFVSFGWVNVCRTITFDLGFLGGTKLG
jgi:hypothetical protein